ncbi:hypothetical protein GCM10007385_29200 [Tateyamaria omphalii]|uniref:hypothetical protein n=1 Tax=Tateyamaria omphalii TaxID=299262 RepID=UPI00167AE472|nr:hypothetical protein [Tateyamaria omphalii]GGX58593.1 hypothetical protein GCM10007385_29200 [Tateyamaria omphalii]
MSTITITLTDESGLTAPTGAVYVAGWINGGSTGFKVLGSDGTFGPLASGATTLSFYEVSSIASVVLNESTNGNDRLLFTACPTAPAALNLIDNNGVYDDVLMYTQYPYLPAPGVAPEGPYDVFEFGMNAAFDLSAVNGFGLNLRFSVPANGGNPAQSYGVQSGVTRQQVGQAFTAFLANQTGIPGAASFSDLLYDGPMPNSTYTPPMVDNQFFAIADPNDFLAASTGNYANTTTSGLQSYWTQTLQAFFTEGNKLAISIPVASAPHNVYSGYCITHTNPNTGTDMLAYKLTNSAGDKTYYFYNPLGADPVNNPNDLQGAQYVFQQAFTDTLTPGIVGESEAMLVQDTIWEAICRGVVLDGTFSDDFLPEDPEYSTTFWNDPSRWYGSSAPSHLYAKFLHCSDVNGDDYRTKGTDPIMLGGAAYGFSMDETPIGAYSGGQVPSKTTYNIGSGTVAVTVGAWT